MKASERALSPSDPESIAPRGSAVEVLRVFTWLGLTSFGGPVAHLGYFRREIVERRGWLGERDYADLVALSQFLPGPASSKVGFSLGLMRAGPLGALAAWIGFTLPTALLLMLFAFGADAVSDSVAGQGLIHGLKLAAVAIVAHAVWGMAQTLCPDGTRIGIGLTAAIVVVLAPGSLGQIAAIALGALLGSRLCAHMTQPVPEPFALPIRRRTGVVALILFVLLLGAAFWPYQEPAAALFAAFYRSGALVFGGGHVVLPLLSEAVVEPGWLDERTFLTGYGAAQAMPGPLFAVATFLGAVATPIGGVAGAAIALVAIFLPGALLQVGALPFWRMLRAHPSMQAAMLGINAAVVGLLAAALYQPVLASAVTSGADITIAVAGFLLLTMLRVPSLWVVLATAAAATAMAI